MLMLRKDIGLGRRRREENAHGQGELRELAAPVRPLP